MVFKIKYSVESPVALELLPEKRTLKPEVLFDQVFTQTRIVMTF